MNLDVPFDAARLDVIAILYIGQALSETQRQSPAIRFLAEPVVAALLDEWARRRAAELGRAAPAAAMTLSLELNTAEAALAEKSLQICAEHIISQGVDGPFGGWRSGAAHFLEAMRSAIAAASGGDKSSATPTPVN